MDEMRAVQYDAYGPPEVLRVATVPVPSLRSGHVLVRAAASSVNAADVLVRRGGVRLVSGRSFPRGSGFDFAGDVVAVADDVTTVGVCDEVWGFVNGLRNRSLGTAAEYVLAPVAAVSRRPTGLDAVAAAALSGAAGAALGALKELGLRSGERVLIRGAAGGVGVAAVQLAHADGARVTALARDEHANALRELGADEVLNHRKVNPADLGTFDVILDPVSTDMPSYQRLLNPGGRMGAMGASRPGQLASIAASAIHRSRRIRLIQVPPGHDQLAELANRVDAKDIKPVIHSTYPLDDIAAAHRSIGTPGGLGKRVVTTN
jgi:NADPH:quinone reductase-like Zn-dependent oxidoreductase